MTNGQLRDAVGRFIADNFLKGELVAERVKDKDLSETLAKWLADPAQPLVGWRFTRLSAGGQLAYNEVIAPAYIDGRRERAWQYLMNHRSGEAVMSAVTQFVQSRSMSGATALCSDTSG